MTLTRRGFLYVAGVPALLRADRPTASAVMAGDVVPGAATIWSKASGPARMIVEWKTSERGPSQRIVGPHCLETSDYTGRVELAGLPAGQTILYQVQFEDLTNSRALSEPVHGIFRTPALANRDVRFFWSADQCGQGFGINPDWGGMKIFETMRHMEPDFFIHSGDTIYADGALQREVKTENGVWRNIVTEEKSKPAETLDEFRGNFRYNLLDELFRNFISSVPQVWQWDDHEVMNNWSPSKNIDDNPLYQEKNVPLLAARAKRAFLDYAPLRISAADPERIYRKISYGPMLDVFVIDLRSYRGPNTYNLQKSEGDETPYMGSRQFAWLKQALRDSRATWKAIASDMPLSLLVADGRDDQGRMRWEASANGDNGAPLGREIEIMNLLRFMKQNRITNTVWFTADVHYTAAHYYDPRKARFTDFLPFWEFVSGPLNAGTFGPNTMDGTFGPEVKFQKTPKPGQMLAPSSGFQFFGDVSIDKRSHAMTVCLRDLMGTDLYRVTLSPAR